MSVGFICFVIWGAYLPDIWVPQSQASQVHQGHGCAAADEEEEWDQLQEARQQHEGEKK